MNKQLLLIITAIILFVSAVIGASFLLAGKSKEQPMDHSAHGDAGKLNEWVGKEAPNFSLYSFQGKKVSLAEQRGKRVVLFFTEGVMCYPACWNQIAAFGKDNSFNNDNTTVLIITVETRGDWERAVKKMPELAAATVLLDSGKNVSNEYGVLMLPSSMHKGQYPGHTYLILDKNGVVRYVKDDPEMGVRNEELKAELEKIN